MSTTYLSATINELPATADKSTTYWRKQAKDVFAKQPSIHTVEVVWTGNKTDSRVIRRGEKNAPSGHVVILASTGGKWGKSRREFWPVDAA